MRKKSRSDDADASLLAYDPQVTTTSFGGTMSKPCAEALKTVIRKLVRPFNGAHAVFPPKPVKGLSEPVGQLKTSY